MYEKTLISAGLEEKQAVVYETLLSLGKSGMGKLVQRLPYKRSNVYNLINELIEKGLVASHEARGRQVFVAESPEKLHDLVEAEKHKVQQAHSALESALPSLRSMYALAFNKPGVRFFEGIEGIKQVLEDTLNNNHEKKIDAFSDVVGYAKYLRDWNTKHYAPKRKKLGIVERVIIPDNAEALEYMKGYQANDITDILFVDHHQYPFATEINLYDNKVSFVTFSSKTHIGVIIDNVEIYQTLSSIFNFLWHLGKQHLADRQPEWLPRPQKSQRPASATGPTQEQN